MKRKICFDINDINPYWYNGVGRMMIPKCFFNSCEAWFQFSQRKIMSNSSHTESIRKNSGTEMTIVNTQISETQCSFI